jgi:hypothetical protein
MVRAPKTSPSATPRHAADGRLAQAAALYIRKNARQLTFSTKCSTEGCGKLLKAEFDGDYVVKLDTPTTLVVQDSDKKTVGVICVNALQTPEEVAAVEEELGCVDSEHPVVFSVKASSLFKLPESSTLKNHQPARWVCKRCRTTTP